MTLVKPYLFLNRLVIISHSGEIAYDEKFHRGVNIVRGKNSSGKSTIANFLFYALGGDFNNWTTEATGCREIFAEVEINDATLTLKRFIKDVKTQSMSVFWGNYEVAIKSNFEGWKHFPYSQTNNLESFSSILFNALEFPQVRSDSDSKITMHQILRLMYIDQDSPTSNLFRFERFDQHLTRQAISELLLGVYDDSLYQDRLNLRDAEKSYKQKKEQYDGVIKVFGDVGSETDVSKVQKEIDKTKNELNKVQEDIIKMREKAQVTLSDKTPLKIEKLQTEIGESKNRLIKLSNEVKSYELDIADSKQFIEVLEKRLISLDNSILTKNILGDLPLEHCPQCLRPIKNHIEENSCIVCRQPFEDDLEKTYAKRLKQEIELQIKESNKLLNEKNKRFATLVSEWNPLVERFRLMQREIDVEEKSVKTTRDDNLDALLKKNGSLENQIIALTRQIKAVEQIEILRKELQELKKEIEKLEQDKRTKENEQLKNLQNARQRIEKIALDILKKDLDRQEEFAEGKRLEVDFANDTFTLNGKHNFSASSNTLLKNAIRFAVFFASLELGFFRYPRFILCDNMEDKGMEKERTQNFQEVITEISNSYEVEHQIIFTTSEISDNLNNTALCVGDYYNRNNKTLKV